MAKSKNKPETTEAGVSREYIVKAGTSETTDDGKERVYKSKMELVLNELWFLISYVNNKGRLHECEKLVRAYNMVEEAYKTVS